MTDKDLGIIEKNYALARDYRRQVCGLFADGKDAEAMTMDVGSPSAGETGAAGDDRRCSSLRVGVRFASTT